MFVKILIGLGLRLLTEKFVSNITVNALEYLAERTTNKLDDKIVKLVAEALEVNLK